LIGLDDDAVRAWHRAYEHGVEGLKTFGHEGGCSAGHAMLRRSNPRNAHHRLPVRPERNPLRIMPPAEFPFAFP
jgi:hypothetical protein